MIFLETNRLIFRTHEPQDEVDFIRMHTDPEVRRYVGGKAWPVEKAVARFRDSYLGNPSEIYGLWATILKEEGGYIGSCGLNARENDAGAASLGYYLARPYWRRGLATEACRGFVEVAFLRLRLERLQATVEQGNEASERILRRLGFSLIGREEIPGRVLLLYELPREEWGRT